MHSWQIQCFEQAFRSTGPEHPDGNGEQRGSLRLRGHCLRRRPRDSRLFRLQGSDRPPMKVDQRLHYLVQCPSHLHHCLHHCHCSRAGCQSVHMTFAPTKNYRMAQTCQCLTIPTIFLHPTRQTTAHSTIHWTVWIADQTYPHIFHWIFHLMIDWPGAFHPCRCCYERCSPAAPTLTTDRVLAYGCHQ